MALTNDRQNNNYVSILGSDGTFRVQVPEGTEGSVVREYELKDGTKGSKIEQVFTTLSGKITGVGFIESEYGKNLILTITDEAGDVKLSMSTEQNFGEDFMKKLPGLDLDQAVTLKPYAFEDDNGKTRKGITVYQDGEKMDNFFYDAEKKKNTNGYPVPEKDGKGFEKDDWKIYFMTARKFLINYTKENFNIIPDNEEAPEGMEQDQVNVDDVPFD